jgi:uncharacterized phiE125 gp8 family phage protein
LSSAPTGQLTIDVVCGHGPDADAVPTAIRQAIMQLITYWYENRDGLSPAARGAAVPESIYQLLQPFKVMRL